MDPRLQPSHCLTAPVIVFPGVRMLLGDNILFQRRFFPALYAHTNAVKHLIMHGIKGNRNIENARALKYKLGVGASNIYGSGHCFEYRAPTLSIYTERPAPLIYTRHHYCLFRERQILSLTLLMERSQFLVYAWRQTL